ncbi:hypothetical protein Hanom_Chr06g00579511 [Helianthus anomalus]
MCCIKKEREGNLQSQSLLICRLDRPLCTCYSDRPETDLDKEAHQKWQKRSRLIGHCYNLASRHKLLTCHLENPYPSTSVQRKTPLCAPPCLMRSWISVKSG